MPRSGQQDAAGLAAIVFVCVVIAFPDVQDPMEQAFHRILDVLVGIVTALLVNAVRLPRVKLHNRVFFIRLEDLAKDQFLRLSPAVLFRLQSLYREDARICLCRCDLATGETEALLKSEERAFIPPLRELAEEVGLDVAGYPLERIYTYENVDPEGGDNYIVDIYRFKLDFTVEDVKLQAEEAIDCKLVSFDEIEQLAERGVFLHYRRIVQALETMK